MTPRTPVVVNISLMGPEWDHDTRVTFLGTEVPDRPPRHVRRRRRRLRRSCASGRPRAAAVAVTGVRDAQVTGLYGGELRARERHHGGGRLDPGHRRHPAPRGPPGVGGTTRRDRDAGLLHQRPDRRARRAAPRPDGPHPARAHRQHRARRPAAAPAACPTGCTPTRCWGSPPTPWAARPAWPCASSPTGCGRRSPRPATLAAHALARRAARDCDVLVATYDELTGFGLEDLAGKTLITSDDLAGAAGRPGRPGRRPGRRRDAAAVRRRDGQRGHAGGADDGVGPPGQHAHPRRPAGHDRRRRPGAAAAPAQRAPAQEPVRVRHPPAVAGVPAQRRAAPHHLAHRAGTGHGPGREGRGLQPAVHLQPRHRHHVPDGRGGGGLAHLRRGHTRTR